MADTKERKPEPPFPEQHLDPPGLEVEMSPRPRYEAPEYHGSGKLAGKVALITGGDSGIGRAVAVLFAREGADCALVFLDEEWEDGRETLRAIENEGGRGLAIVGDVRDPDFCRERGHPRVHQVTGVEPPGQGHSGQLCRARPRVDTPEPRRASGRGREGLRHEDADGAAGATGGDRSGVCVLRVER
jgi:hypothetical protein